MPPLNKQLQQKVKLVPQVMLLNKKPLLLMQQLMLMSIPHRVQPQMLTLKQKDK